MWTVLRAIFVPKADEVTTGQGDVDSAEGNICTEDRRSYNRTGRCGQC